MKKAENELMHNVEKRFELVISLAIFLPTIILVLLEIANKSDQEINKTVLSWSAGIGVYLLGYFFLQVSQKDFNSWIIKLINYSLLSAFLCYGIAVTYIASVVGAKIDFAQWLHIIALKTSVVVLLLVPFVILTLVLLNALICLCKFIYSQINFHRWFNDK